MRIVAVIMILLSAQVVAAQPADPDPPRPITVGVSMLHQFSGFSDYDPNRLDARHPVDSDRHGMVVFAVGFTR